MNSKKIIVSKNADGTVQYLTEILPEIPTNTILYKKLTGLGATYCEIKANRNSVIIEPNKPVIIGKCQDPKHKADNIFGVYEGIYTDDVVRYIEKSKGKKLKIMTTPESFRKVREAFEDMDLDVRFDCFLLFDECHKIVKDVEYRKDITLPMDFFFSCEHKALVSATPIEFTDPRFEEQDFTVLEIIPDFDYKKDLMLHTTNNILQTTREVFDQLKDTSELIFIFCNSTDTIFAMMEQIGITDNSTVFCSDKSVEKLKGLKFKHAYDTIKIREFRKYNWLTSRFYNAVDIEIDQKPTVILLTHCYFTEYTVFDPYTDAVQCAGRFRNGISALHLIGNTNSKFMVRTKEELKGYIDCSEDIYNQIKALYDNATTVSERDAYYSALSILPFQQMLDENKQKNYFAIDNYVNDKLVKSYYQSRENLLRAFNECGNFYVAHYHHIYKYGDKERLQIKNNSNSLKEKRKLIVQQLDLLGECMTELDYQFKDELQKADSFIVEAYDKLGKNTIEGLRYCTKHIKEALILQDYNKKAHSADVLKCIKNSFKVGKRYTRKFVKDEIKRIFSLFNVVPKKAVTSFLIDDYYYTKEVTIKRQKGVEIISSKF